MQIDSFTLLSKLKSLNLLESKSPWWWERAQSFDVVIGAILTQNTKWEAVEKSLTNLKNANILQENSDKSLHALAESTQPCIQNLILPSGFYRQKAARLISLSRAILEDFGDFESFRAEVSREWLLAQKGIGFESADSILNYACAREIMVIDAYTARLLKALGYEMEQYEDIQNWCMSLSEKELKSLYGEMPLAQIYARFHGKIVEFSKAKLSPQILLSQESK